MSAAGDAVLAEAQRWIGTTEYPPGSNAGPWWDAWGANYGSWCAAAVSMWVTNALGPGAMCAVDGDPGFMLVSNGVQHAYSTDDTSSATGLEAQRTPDLQPGDVVNYSWEAWRWEGTPGAGGYPVCDGGPYDGWPAGDHTGVVKSAPDSAGYFAAVEGNTSVNGSQDNGGAVLERTRHVSQVCSWWRPVGYGAGPEPGPPPEEDWLSALTDQEQRDLLSMVTAIKWMVGNMEPAAGAEPNAIGSRVQAIHAEAVPGMGGVLAGQVTAIKWMVGNLDPSAENTPLAIGSRVQDIQRMVAELHAALVSGGGG